MLTKVVAVKKLGKYFYAIKHGHKASKNIVEVDNISLMKGKKQSTKVNLKNKYVT